MSQVIRDEVPAAESTSSHGRLKTTFEQSAENAVSVTVDNVTIIMSVGQQKNRPSFGWNRVNELSSLVRDGSFLFCRES